MKRFASVAAVAATALAATAVAGSVPGTTQSSDERALAPIRQAPSATIEAKVSALLSRMTTQREAATGAAVLRRPDHRRGREGGGRRRLQPDRSGEDQPLPAPGRGAVPPAHPDPVRLRHHPRLPDHLPGPARCRQLLRPERRHDRRPDRSTRVRDRRHQAGLQPHGRRLPRATVGPDRRGRRRGPVPRIGVRRGPGQGRPGHRLLRPQQGGRQCEALRRYGAARGRPRLQHHRPVRAAAAQPLPAALQGRDRRRRGHRDVLVQRDQRCARVCEPLHGDRHPQEGVGLRRLHRERLHRRRGDPRLPAEEARRRLLRPRDRRRRSRCRREGADGGHRLGDGQHEHPRLR